MRSRSCAALMLASALAVASCAFETTTDEETRVEGTASEELALGGRFIIAADYQPHRLFDRWKRRGVNTVIRVPGGDSIGEWTEAANRHGLFMIREPRDDARRDRDERRLLAWTWVDEPELHHQGIRHPPSDLAHFRDRMHQIDPRRPILVNFWGGGIIDGGRCYDGFCYPDYIRHADWISADIYPCNKLGGNIRVVGRVVSQLRRWADNDQSVFAYIETSDFDGDGVGPTARQFRGEIWHAIVHGARGLLYFAVRLSSDGCCSDYDATPTDVADAMTRHHPLVTRLAPVLQAPIDPDDLGIAVDEPLEATWRAVPEGRYFIVLNFSDSDRRGRSMHVRHTSARSADVIGESRSVRIAEDGTMVDDFGPYEPHVYRIR